MLTFQQISDLVRGNWDSRAGPIDVHVYGQGLRITHASGKTVDIALVSRFDLERPLDGFHSGLVAPALQRLKDSLAK